MRTILIFSIIFFFNACTKEDVHEHNTAAHSKINWIVSLDSISSATITFTDSVGALKTYNTNANWTYSFTNNLSLPAIYSISVNATPISGKTGRASITISQDNLIKLIKSNQSNTNFIVSAKDTIQ